MAAVSIASLVEVCLFRALKAPLLVCSNVLLRHNKGSCGAGRWESGSKSRWKAFELSSLRPASVFEQRRRKQKRTGRSLCPDELAAAG
jgi:hypothetical protein